VLSVVALIVIMVIVVLIAVTFAVPPVIVRKLAVGTIPVTRKELMSIVMRRYPMSPLIGWPGPVAAVPPIVIAHWIPVASNPKEIGSRSRRHNMNDARPRRRPDSYSDRNLRLSYRHAAQKNRG